MAFFAKTPNQLLRKTFDNEEIPLEEKEGKVIFKPTVSKSELLLAISGFEESVFAYKYFKKPNKYDNEKAFVFTLALDILANLKTKIYPVLLLIPILYLSHTLVTYICHTISFAENRQVAFFELLLVFFWWMYDGARNGFCGIFMFWALKNMSSKFTYMEELKEMMSMERLRSDNNTEKLYPTLNILDFMSLKSWTCLRKVFMHLNDEKLEGQILAVTTIMILEFVTIVTVALYYLKILGDPKIDYSPYMLLYGLSALVYLSSFLVLVYFAAKVNAQFQVHRNLIRANKQTATLLFRLYPDFIGENAIEPATYIHKEGLKYLKKEFGDEITPEIKKKMKEKFRILIETYDSVLEELDYEETQNPIKILGLPITSTVVKTFGTIVASIATPFIKQLFTSLYAFIKTK